MPGFSAGDQTSAARQRLADLFADRIAQIGARARTDLHALFHRIADDLRACERAEAFEKLVVDGLFNDEALGRDAAFAVVLKARLDGGRGRRLHVGVGEDDERVGTAQFEHALFECVAGRASDGHPGAFAPGQRDGGDARIADEIVGFLTAYQKHAETALRRAGIGENALDLQRATRGVCRVLEQERVARHQRGSRPRERPARTESSTA